MRAAPFVAACGQEWGTRYTPQAFGPDGMWSGVSSLDPALIVQRPRTPAFQAGNTGSNPVGGTLGAW